MSTRIVVHADESCLGNGREGRNPGGAGGLIEIARPSGVSRRDFFLSEPDTTNNRMAIRSAIEALTLLGVGRTLSLDFVSDSEYLVKGMSQWMAGWKRRSWKNVKNPELWQALDALAAGHDVNWRWVRGHDKEAKNEYADFLATRAASEQSSSNGLATSGFLDWLELEKAKGHYADFDPDDLG
ncbi:MAG TPA: ribonuclease H [Gemmatimonadales bacterium]